MFKSEVFNRVLNIIWILVLMILSLNTFGTDTLSRLSIILILTFGILFNLYKIIKVSKQDN